MGVRVSCERTSFERADQKRQTPQIDRVAAPSHVFLYGGDAAMAAVIEALLELVLGLTGFFYDLITGRDRKKGPP
jgi:hypothetical protein